MGVHGVNGGLRRHENNGHAIASDLNKLGRLSLGMLRDTHSTIHPFSEAIHPQHHRPSHSNIRSKLV